MKKRIITISAIAAAVILLILGYCRFMAPTRIATVNFPDFSVEKMITSNDNGMVKIEMLGLDDIDKFKKYDMILVRVHGSSLGEKHLEAIKKAKDKGVAVFSTESENSDINSQSGREQEYLATLMDNGCTANYRSFFNYVRKNIDRKTFFNGSYDEPVIVPADYYFHPDNDGFFRTVAEYEEYYRSTGIYKEGAPRVALLAGNINAQNSNIDHIAALVSNMEARGMNVYPIQSFGTERLRLLAEVRPDIIINQPHGRLVMGGGESGTKMLEKLGVPVLAPVTVSELYDKWLTDEQGMAAGGMTSMSVVMPELDGAIYPFAVSAQFERNGLKLFEAIPGRAERFSEIVKNFTELRNKPNSEKKVAVYYYKGNGKGALSASDLEGVPSLFNTLQMLKKNGYNVAGLPDDVKTFEDMIQQRGPVLGPYALGAFDGFLRTGDPALVDAETFASWTDGTVPDALVEDMKSRYGEFPGDYMAVEKNGKKYISIARLQFGNVVILPQPLPSVGEDTEKLVHGVKGAPAYPYVASYLWVKNGFGADAMVHFGTHGSLEFIPGKQVALSDYDWSDVLVDDMPHFYIYTISNIGEGIIAKRRGYATLLSHLTAPFMQSGLYGDLKMLKDMIHRMDLIEEGPVKQNYREAITEMAGKQNILSALLLDSTRVLNDEEIEKVHIYLEEINGEKVNDGLYTLGVPYPEENLNNTTKLMSIEPLRYALAAIDMAHGRISNEEMDNLAFVAHNYDAKSETAISKALRGTETEKVFAELVSPADAGKLKAVRTKEEAIQKHKADMMRRMMAAMTPKVKETPRFFDENGNFAEVPQEPAKESSMPEMSAMEMMAKAMPVGAESAGKDNSEEDLTIALKKLWDALENIPRIKSDLKNSTSMEQQAFLTALAGGYIQPGSAGDPVINPAAVPTGKNFYSINPEATPSEEAWKVGKRLAENLLAAEFAANGKYPEKISFTLWSTDFISTEGATIAQILYLLGVEPLRDGFGYIRSLRLIPAEELGRPRVDIVVQTSGQLRDIAASRLELINRAVAMAAEANDGQADNYVKKGLKDSEKYLLDKGMSPVEARKYAAERVFGGVNGNYGTGIMGMVEQGDSWNDRSEIAARYIGNMGAIYSDNGGEEWGKVHENVFEAALLNTSVVVQPRSSNTWGPLSLDHVYEFMGGLSAAVEHVTGNDPAAYFNDLRNSSRPRVQGLKEAIGVESNATVFNPKYIGEMMKGEASSMEYFAETFRNTYGWNSMKPSAIDNHIWDKYYDVYVKDEYNMNLPEKFTSKNPYALQEMTAVMLEAARKGMWKATDAQLSNVADMHAKLVTEKEAGCSGFVCDNKMLREFITGKLSPDLAKTYNTGINDVRQVNIKNDGQDNVVLKKEGADQQRPASQVSEKKKSIVLPVTVAVIAVLLALLVVRRRRK